MNKENLPKWANCWAENKLTGEIKPAFYSHVKDELTDENGNEMIGWVDITSKIINRKWLKVLVAALILLFCTFLYASLFLKEDPKALDKTFKNERCGENKEDCKKYLN